MKSRRAFIKQTISISLGFAGLSAYLNNPVMAYSSLLKNETTKWLELPIGFNAKLISTWGDKMADGFRVPGNADGMGSFLVKGKTVVVRNHENLPTNSKVGPFGDDMGLFTKISRNTIFDYGYGKTPGLGGTTTFVFDEDKQEITNQFLSLVGTYRNCAGGVTPWNSWITCEEDVTKKGEKAEVNHGYNFEVPAFNKKLINPTPLKAMGRFNHEAICVDPKTGIIYQTEDRGDSLIYRFIPTKPGQLQKGGVLQALVIKGQKECDTRNWVNDLLKVGQEYETEWITLNDVDTIEDDLRLRGKALGAAVFARGEGMWFGAEEVFFACTNGGNKKAGQVFKYIPSPSEGKTSESTQPGKLILFAEPNNTDILKYCDNLTVAPWGDVVLVEDSSNAHIRGITPEGKIYTIGRNVGSASELAGVCFSPSGKTMFINIQVEGLTFAVTGPWNKLRPA